LPLNNNLPLNFASVSKDEEQLPLFAWPHSSRHGNIYYL
jgi:hypothetical protein